jgi:hypothetical protein
MKKVISFSIYGDNPKYTIGMLKNLELSKVVYPDWTVFIYYNSTVPLEMIEKYKEFDNCELFNMDGYNLPGMFWRFLTHDKEDVERFISRDADSRISMREKLAVDEWIESGKTLHIIRDHPNHGIPIYGGLFGLIRDIHFNLENEMIKWLVDKNKDLFAHNVDTFFLENIIYNRFLPDVNMISHNSFHSHFPNSRPFPTPLEDFKFVGEVYDQYDNRYDDYRLLIHKKEIR